MGAGQFPLVVGGDCPVLLGALRGAQDVAGRTALLFVDGHEDAWPPRQSTTGEAADCELGFALGRHRTELPADFVAELPELDPRDVVALGPRDADELAGYGVDPLPPAVTLHRDDALTGDAATAISSAVVRDFTARRLPWWLHVDLDVLSTAAFPAVDYPQDGGLGWAELRQITASALQPGCLGMTVTIYNPDLDPAATHAQAVVDYLADTVGHGAPATTAAR
ncbi:hypothetical protein GCM10029976_031230 [Kribbella albertanoniae]